MRSVQLFSYKLPPSYQFQLLTIVEQILDIYFIENEEILSVLFKTPVPNTTDIFEKFQRKTEGFLGDLEFYLNIIPENYQECIERISSIPPVCVT